MKQRLLLPLDLQMFAGEKTESATPKKRQEARKKGQVAKSMELPGAFILFFSFLSFYLLGGYMKDRLFSMFSGVFEHDLLMDMTISNVNSLFSRLMLQGLLVIAPILLITVIIAILGNYLQIGFLISGDPLMMKLSKINPIEGFKKIFSLRSLVDFLKSSLKMAIVAYVVYRTLFAEEGNILSLGHLTPESILRYTASVTVGLGVKIGLILVILAIFDYIFQRYEYEKSLKMSKQEIKDEYKKTEGDPLIKGKIRERQRRMAMQRMMQEVPKADVIITNPTHFAVALKYDAKQMEAPQVIAKGADYIALKMKELAKQHGIITMENKPLARALYAQTEIGETIPAELFQAVAEVLAYVYKLKGNRA